MPVEKARKKRKGRSFDRPRSENTKHLSTGLWTFARVGAIDARWFRGLRHCPEMDSLYHAVYIVSEEIRKNKNFYVVAEGGGVEPPSGPFPERWFSGPESVAVASRPPME